MSDINSVIINGRLVRDKEEKTTQTGTVITRFSLANGYSRKEGDSWKNETNFFDCVMIGKNGLSAYLSKGRQVTILGELRQQRWEQNGEKKSKVEILVRSLQLLGETQKKDQVPDSAYDNAPKAKSDPDDKSVDDLCQQLGSEFTDSDIPF